MGCGTGIWSVWTRVESRVPARPRSDAAPEPRVLVSGAARPRPVVPTPTTGAQDVFLRSREDSVLPPRSKLAVPLPHGARRPGNRRDHWYRDRRWNQEADLQRPGHHRRHESDDRIGHEQSGCVPHPRRGARHAHRSRAHHRLHAGPADRRSRGGRGGDGGPRAHTVRARADRRRHDRHGRKSGGSAQARQHRGLRHGAGECAHLELLGHPAGPRARRDGPALIGHHGRRHAHPHPWQRVALAVERADRLRGRCADRQWRRLRLRLRRHRRRRATLAPR